MFFECGNFSIKLCDKLSEQGTMKGWFSAKFIVQKIQPQQTENSLKISRQL